MKWLKNAFAVDPPGPAEPTEEQKEATEWLCGQVVRRRMTTPSLMTLSLCRPINFVISQAMIVSSPVVELFTYNKGYQNFAKFLEHRGSVEYLCNRIEELEAETVKKETQNKPEKDLSQDDFESSFHTDEFH